MNIYPAHECVFFYRNRDPFAEFSNMCGGMGIVVGQRVWAYSEGLYQALRYPGRDDIHEKINAAENAFMAKKVAYEFINQTRSDWQDVKVNLMEAVLRQKLAQNFLRLKTVLDMTGDKMIVEKSLKDAFWGAMPDGRGNLVGENVLGVLWMIIREEVNAGTFSYEEPVFEL